MRRLALLSLTVSGIVLLLFGANIVLFMLVPAYHDALTGVVTKDEQIPTVVIDENNGIVVIEGIEKTNVVDVDASIENDLGIDDMDLTIEDEKMPLSENAVVNCEKRIVDKTYYEDCGSDKGYWIIKYEDGSTSVEQ